MKQIPLLLVCAALAVGIKAVDYKLYYAELPV